MDLLGIFKRESKVLRTARENVKRCDKAIEILEKENLGKGDVKKLTKILRKVNPSITKEWVKKWVEDDQGYFWSKIWSVKTHWQRVVERLEREEN